MSSILKAALSGGMSKIIERFSERTVRKAGKKTSRSVDLLRPWCICIMRLNHHNGHVSRGGILTPTTIDAPPVDLFPMFLVSLVLFDSEATWTNAPY
jgi:hypothetical protein